MIIRIFTDGACSDNPGPGGWGAVINIAESCLTISGGEDNTTNNRMELKAIIEVMKEVLKKSSRKHNHEVFSDSAYVVNSINSGWVNKWQTNNWKTTKGGDVKNKDLWEEFLKLRQELRYRNFKFEIFKIKGHSGNAFNELADKLAKGEALKIKEGTKND